LSCSFFSGRLGQRALCQWNALRETMTCAAYSAHRRIQECLAAGVFAAFWREGLLAYDALQGIDWTWLALDGSDLLRRLFEAKVRRCMAEGLVGGEGVQYAPCPVRQPQLRVPDLGNHRPGSCPGAFRGAIEARTSAGPAIA
jgi:hypothetical protein